MVYGVFNAAFGLAESLLRRASSSRTLATSFLNPGEASAIDGGACTAWNATRSSLLPGTVTPQRSDLWDEGR